MTKIKYAYIHPGFQTGHNNKPNLVDVPFMSTDEQVQLLGWMQNIDRGMEHEGLNKPSWLYKGLEIAAAKVYKQNNIWHYHCGPYDPDLPYGFQMTDNQLSMNTNGRQSGPVYHYAKQNDTIIVIGFSREHQPFPNPTSRSNPLKHRAHTWKHGLPQG